MIRTAFLRFMFAFTCAIGAHAGLAQAQTPDAPVIAPHPAPLTEPAAPAAAPASTAKAAPAKATPPAANEATSLIKLTEQLQVCADMKDRALRLRCYDEEITKLGLMEKQDMLSERQRIETYGFWQVLSEKDQLGVETIYLTISPYNEMAAAILRAKNPTFNIRCRQGVTDAYIDWKSVLNGRRGSVKELQVYTKIDSDPDKVEWWSLSTDGFAAFAPDSVKMVQSIRNKERLIVRLTPVDYNAETMAFEIKDFERALDIMVKRCYKN